MVCSLCDREVPGSFSLEVRLFLCRACELVVERFLERVPVEGVTPCEYDHCGCSCHFEGIKILYGA